MTASPPTEAGVVTARKFVDNWLFFSANRQSTDQSWTSQQIRDVAAMLAEFRSLAPEPDGIERAVRFVRQLARTSVAMDEDEAEERLRAALTKPGGCMACGGLGYIDRPDQPCDCSSANGDARP